MWKIQDISITQILREINFGEIKLEVLKLPFLPFLGSEFCQFAKLQPSKSAKIPENQNSEPLNV